MSNIGPEASEEKSFEILNIFPIQMYGALTNAQGSKLDLILDKCCYKIKWGYPTSCLDIGV